MDGDPQSSIDAIVNEAIFRVTEVDDQGLRALTEVTDPEELSTSRADGPRRVPPRRADARRSTGWPTSSARHDVGDQPGLHELDRGSFGGPRRLASTGPSRPRRPRWHELPDSVTSRVRHPRRLIVAAQEAVAALKVLLSTEVASELGVTISFSDADGDS